MKTILHNAKVYVEKGNYCQAVLIEDGIISKVGQNAEILSMKEPDTEIIDCQGKTLIPGLNDSHMHFTQLGEKLEMAQINNVKSIAELIQVCKDFIATHPEVSKKGLHAIGWNQDLFIDGDGVPDRHDLDKITTEFPVVLERVCGHVASSNTKAIEVLGLNENSKQYPGGLFYTDERSYPTGVFTEAAVTELNSIIPDFTMEERRAQMLETMNYAASHGLTSVQSNDVGTTFFDAPQAFKLLHDIYDEGLGKTRYRHQVCFNRIEELKEYLETGEYVKGNYPEGSWLTLGPLKLFKDGSLGGRTAMLKNGYPGDPDNHGVVWMSQDEMEKYCLLAKEHGLQVITHVIGDQAAEETINAYEKAFIDGKNKLRHTLVHCQVTDQEILDRIIDEDILVAAQPVFIDYDMKILEDICGKELASTSYNFGTLLRRGCHLSYGTDCPVEDCNPFPNIYMAVTRKGADGLPEGGFYPKECVDVETAIDAYTYESAYMEFQENVKGRIKTGYYADMVLLDKDIFTCDPMEIKDILPVMTMVGGKIVYRR